MSEIGTKLPIQNVRSPVANGGKADNICSLRDLPVLTDAVEKVGVFDLATVETTYST